MENLENQVSKLEHDLEPPKSKSKENHDSGEEVSGDVKLIYQRSTDTPMYIDRVKLLLRSIGNEPPLPTQILFPDQSEEALALVKKYIDNIRNILVSLGVHGVGLDVRSYAYRVSHMLKEMEWVDVVVRLQFATSLFAILETLNSNLDPNETNKWGVLEFNDGKYSINGEVLNFGDRVDVYTVNETVLSHVQFNSQEVLNCHSINGDTLPIFNIPLDEIERLDTESIEKRAVAKTEANRHLLGVDAWSFLNGLLYRISKDPEEDVIGIETDILTKIDLDPKIDQKEYRQVGSMLVEQDLPYGLNHGLISAYRDYYCKTKEVFDKFTVNLKKIYEDPTTFRNNLSKSGLGNEFVIDNIHSLLLLLDGKSKLLRVKLVMMDGTVKNAVTITRPLSMTTLGTFARFNPRPILFQEIDYDKRPKANRSFLDRVRGANKVEYVGLDSFTLVDNPPIHSADVLGYVAHSAKAYYFADDSSVELDDKFNFFHILKKKFKTK